MVLFQADLRVVLTLLPDCVGTGVVEEFEALESVVIRIGLCGQEIGGRPFEIEIGERVRARRETGGRLPRVHVLERGTPLRFGREIGESLAAGSGLVRAVR